MARWSIGGVEPGASVDAVQARLGEPLVRGRAVWEYSETAVIFRDQKVMQILGAELERDSERLVLQRPSYAFEGQEFTQGPVVSHPADPPRTSRGVVLPYRLLWRRALSTMEVRPRGSSDSDMRRAIWEYLAPCCLPFDLGPARSGLLVSSRGADARPAHLRCHLWARAIALRTELSGQCPIPVVALDEIEPEEQVAVRERLALSGPINPDNIWSYDRERVPLTEDALRTAAALARIIDAGFAPRPVMFPGPHEHIWPLGSGLGGKVYGKPWWRSMGNAAPDFQLDAADAVDRFHALLAPGGATLKAREHDRLAEVVGTLDALEKVSAERGRWKKDWCASLPGNEAERKLMGLVAQLRHEHRDPNFVATGVARVADRARAWLPSACTAEQSRLAMALAMAIRLGLRVLSCEPSR